MWLQQKGYDFWSMGHCYSPSLDYKRQLGHRIYPRTDFIARLGVHRGPFRYSDSSTSSTSDTPGATAHKKSKRAFKFEGTLGDGECCDAPVVLAL